MALVIANRDVLTNSDGIKVLSLQQHVITVKTDSVTLVERSPVGTHDTFVTRIGIRHSELRTICTTSQGHRMILLNGILILECTPPVCTCPTAVNFGKNVLRNIACPIQLLTRSVESVLINDGHVLRCIQQLRTLVGVRPTNSTIVRKLNLTSLTLFCGYQDNTVSSTGTINSSRSSILQHVDGLDISRVNVVKASTCYTVNHIKRCRVTSGTNTTDVNLVTLTWL